jgi:hypothetical protein
LLVSLVLVGVPLGAVVVARTVGRAPTAAAQRRHYFLVGERICLHALKTLPGSDQRAGLRLAFMSGRYPAEYRAAVAAGCEAAIRRLPLLGSGSPAPSS